jgi:succinate dehydrogenase / fumarate reductase, cytochrome b subunit
MINVMHEIKVAGPQINMPNTKRPVFLNLLQIRLPIMGWVSIAHRLTGVLLFLLLPLPLWLWQRSLNSAADFSQVAEWLAAWPFRLILLLMLWWFLHHLFAGIRFLLLDMEIGSSLKAARGSAIALLLLDGLLLIVGGWWLL